MSEDVYVWWRAIREAVNDSCTCGGSGHTDPSACPACVVYHRLRPRCVTLEKGKMRSSSVGVMQIKPSTARDVASDLDVMHPWGNALAGLCHMRKLLDQFGDVRTALHAYHAGGGTVRRNQVKQATRNYADDILSTGENE